MEVSGTALGWEHPPFLLLAPRHLPTGETVGEGMTTQVPLSRRLPLGQVQTGPLGLSRQSHSHFLRSQGLVTAGREGTMWGEPTASGHLP